MERKVVTIKWKTGEMELSIRDFLDIQPSPQKTKGIADLAKKSDRDFGTNVVTELQLYISQLIDSEKTASQDWEYRRKTSSYVKLLERIMMNLREPLPKIYKAKRLF